MLDLINNEISDVFIIGAKSIGLYGGYESFVLNLLKQHRDIKQIRYHIVCKENGSGHMDLNKLPEAIMINSKEFSYCCAHCILIKIPEKIGSAQAIIYDIKALKWVCDYIENKCIHKPIVYILASRIGPFEKKYVRRIHKAKGLVYQNPDGHEDWRRKWSYPIRKYWKLSERFSIKNADLVICDSKLIEEYIKNEYLKYKKKTTYISYGADITSSSLSDNDSMYIDWLRKNSLIDKEYYLVIGRCVPENNYDIIIREFMLSNTKKDLVFISTSNDKMLKKINKKYCFDADPRIKFVGTVYNQELLRKIRENAYCYIHGHSVGGTNPSLLEAMSSTNLNLLFDVGFNKEVGKESCLYWNDKLGNLSSLINKVDKYNYEDIIELSKKAKNIINEEYSWKVIGKKYLEVFGV